MNMSQNQEIIEAKLCAYIDGELDAEGRVEIERHLEANPQHRRLLESLRATRDLLKWLPREAAPAEVAETLNGQLERSVLLDDTSETLGPSIWPRVLAAAAIIFLTVGLFAAVYFTLPKSQKSAIPYARESAAAPEQSAGEVDRLANAQPEGNTVASEHPEGAIAMKGGIASNSATTVERELSEQKRPELDRLAMEVSQNRTAIVAAANGLNYAPGAAGNTAPTLVNNAVVVLVKSSSPPDTRKQLVNYMDSQRILWKETPQQTQLNAAALPEVQPQTARQQALAARQVNERDAAKGQLGSAATQEFRSEATVAPSPLMQQQREAMGRRPTTQPSGYAMNGWNVAEYDATGDLYVARMSRQQAVQLGNTISQEGSQTVELKDLENKSAPQSPMPLTTQSSAESLAARGAGGAMASLGPTTRSTELKAARDEAPASQAAEAIAVADRPLDVVIVVQSAAAPATQAAATQPAGPGPPNADAAQTQPAQPSKP
jgi:hypothetical protein